MANKTVTVRPSGGTYTSLAAAIAGELVANANLVTMEGILTISIEGTWSSPDTTEVSITGFTVNSSYYVNIVTDSANRAGTSWSTSKYRLTPSADGSNILACSQDYTRVTGLQIASTGTTCGNGIVVTGIDNAIFDSCFIANSIFTGAGIYNVTGSSCYRNCIVTNITGNGVEVTSYGGEPRLYNLTVTNCSGVGINLPSGTWNILLTNCYSGGNTGADIAGTDGTITTCRTEDGSRSTTTVAYTTSNFTNVTDGSEDLSTPASSALVDIGTSLASADFPFDWDIVGTTRTTWDVGAYEYTTLDQNILGAGKISSLASPGLPIIYPNYNAGDTFLAPATNVTLYAIWNVSEGGDIVGAGGIASGGAIGLPIVSIEGESTIIGAGGIPSTATEGAPSLSVDISGAGNIATSTNIGSPTISTVPLGAPISRVDSAVGYASGSGTTLDISTTLDLQVGDMVVAFAGWSINGATASIALVGGEQPLDMGPLSTNYYSIFTQMGRAVITSAVSSATFRLTLDTAATNRSITIIQYRPDSSKEIGYFEGFHSGNQTAASVASESVDLVGNDVVAVAFSMLDADGTFSNHAVGGVAATEAITNGSRVAAWYSAFSSAAPGITGTASLAASAESITDIMVIRAVPKGTSVGSLRVWANAAADHAYINSCPPSGVLITCWVRPAAMPGAYPHNRGNLMMLDAEGDVTRLWALTSNGGADYPSVGVGRYNANTTLGAEGRVDWGDDYTLIVENDHRVSEVDFFAWQFYAVQFIINATSVILRQWSKPGRAGRLRYITDTVALPAGNPQPDDLLRLYFGRSASQGSDETWYDMSQIRVYSRSSVPTIEEIDNLSFKGDADTSAWADWEFAWDSTADEAILTDRSGNNRNLSVPTGGALIEGVPFFNSLGSPAYISGVGGIGTGAVLGSSILTVDLSGAGGIATGEVSGTPNVATTISSTGIATPGAIGSPSLSVVIGSAGISSGEVVGNLSLSAGIGSTGIVSGEALGTPGISISIDSAGIASPASVGNPTLSVVISSSAISTGEGMGTPAIQPNIGGSGISSGEGLGQPSLSVQIASAGISSGESIGLPIVSAEGVATIGGAGGITSSASLGGPSLSVWVDSTGIPSGEIVGNPSLGAIPQEIVDAGGIASGGALGAPSLSANISNTGIPSSEVLGLAILSASIADIGGIPSSGSVGQPTIRLVVSPEGVASLEIVGSPDVTYTPMGPHDIIDVGGIVSGEVVGSPYIRGSDVETCIEIDFTFICAPSFTMRNTCAGGELNNTYVIRKEVNV